MEIYNDAKTIFALNADPRQCFFEDLNLPLQSSLNMVDSCLPEPPPLESLDSYSPLSGGASTPGSSSSLTFFPTNSNSPSSVGSERQVLPCSVCGDKAFVKHYGVVACEGCKGFFKRSVRNNRKYQCLGSQVCDIDRKSRNRCQFCRFQKCLEVGMKTEAVQDEALKKDKKDTTKRKAGSGTGNLPKGSPVEVTSSRVEMPLIPIDSVVSAEGMVDPAIQLFANTSVDPIRHVCLAADKQLASLAEWAKKLPHFTSLEITDQVVLLQWSWPELLIGGFCHRSCAVKDGILLATGLHLTRENLKKAGVGALIDKIFGEVIEKLQEMQLDRAEWGCLRAVMLFSPDAKGLKDVQQVETFREMYSATLEDYMKKTRPDQPDRFTKVILRVPALKSIGLQALEHLYFFKLIGDVPMDTFLLDMLEVNQ
ncbi:retinoic acid receptor RXR-alpha-B-like isoform X2 [Rhopilema esculentum]|uniref:retinoic acid receptor RXR-alpha-B-like isoform X2 n=1 Tax=Rhopilema esculentum TaxID=499914 RepID=UPI0031D4C9E7